MPLSEVTLETLNPAGVHITIVQVLEADHYEIVEDSSTKVVADHSHSASRSAHILAVEFQPQPKDHCIPTKVTISIDHKESEST